RGGMPETGDLCQKSWDFDFRLLSPPQPPEELHQHLSAEGDRDIALLSAQSKGRPDHLDLGQLSSTTATEGSLRAGHFPAVPDMLQQRLGEAFVIGSIDQGAKLRALAHACQRDCQLGGAEADVVLSPQRRDGDQIALRCCSGEVDIDDRQQAALVSEMGHLGETGGTNGLVLRSEPALALKEAGQHVLFELPALAPLEDTSKASAPER